MTELAALEAEQVRRVLGLEPHPTCGFVRVSFGSHEVTTIGPDLGAGQQLQLLIPGSTFHTARVESGRRWFLGASTEWPGVEPSDVVQGDPDELARQYPDAASLIREFVGR